MNQTTLTNLPTTTVAVTTTTAASNQPFSGFTWQGYLRSVICVMGLLTNGINMAVFVNPQLKETSYRFMLSKSAANFLYLAVSFVNEFLVYCVNCGFSTTYLAVLYIITMYVYSIGTLSIYRAFIENMILLHTFCILTNKNWTRKISAILIILVLFVLACAYNVPKLFAYSIQKTPGQETFYVSSTEFGTSATNKSLVIGQTLFKIVLTSITLPIINFLNMILFRRRFKNRVIHATTMGGGTTTQCKKNTIDYIF